MLSRQPDIDVVGEAVDGVEAVERAETLTPDVLLKDSPRDELFRAVRAVARGESLLQPAVATRLLDRFARPRVEQTQESLTEREVDVLRLLAKGSANKQIGVQLHISESTVKTHV